MSIHRLFVLSALAAILLATGSSAASTALDPQIASMISAVNATSLRHWDNGLLVFGTRNLFSERLNNPKRGVFAARDWIKSEFERIDATSGGRLTVALDEYTQPKTEYTPREVLVSSVVATLKGDDPGGRTYVMTSHYDSRNSDGNDATKDAPGADDNGSGVSAVLEAARVMAPHHFHGTIIFATYDGEEQGLFGSGHHAKVLRDAGVPVVANINNDIIGSSSAHDGTSDPYEVRLLAKHLRPVKHPSTSMRSEPRTIRPLAISPDSSNPSRKRTCQQCMRASFSVPIVSCAAETSNRLRRKGLRPCALSNRTKSTTISIKTCGLKTAYSTATCRSTWTSTIWRA